MLPVRRNCGGLLAGGVGRIVENFWACNAWEGLEAAGGVSGGGAFCFIWGNGGGAALLLEVGVETLDGLKNVNVKILILRRLTNGLCLRPV